MHFKTGPVEWDGMLPVRTESFLFLRPGDLLGSVVIEFISWTLQVSMDQERGNVVLCRKVEEVSILSIWMSIGDVSGHVITTQYAPGSNVARVGRFSCMSTDNDRTAVSCH